MSRRCDTCEFWAAADPLLQDSKHPDDRIGACRRNAPSPTTGDYQYYVLMALWLIAPEDKTLHENWEEACTQSAVWPSTSGSDWCGGWQQAVKE